jgi:hypothetical protein
MYTWIWRHLPGGTGAKAVLAVLLAVVVASLLLFWVFPTVSGYVDLWNPAV